jgi:nicotinate-nucleotide adenylyltransferase
LIATSSVAIFGGSFDPIHNGHIHLISSILNSQKFDTLIVVPAGDPWQKKPHASKEDRLEMTRLAIKGMKVEVEDCEILRSGPSYAIDTAKLLINRNPHAKHTWIIGSDALLNIGTWHKIDEVRTLIDFLVINRPGHVIDASKVHPEVRWSSIEITALDISATEVRAALASGRDVAHLIPIEVHRYITEKRLYGAA